MVAWVAVVVGMASLMNKAPEQLHCKGTQLGHLCALTRVACLCV